MSQTPKVNIEKYHRLVDRRRALEAEQSALNSDRHGWLDRKSELESLRSSAWARGAGRQRHDDDARYEAQIAEIQQRVDDLGQKLEAVAERLNPLAQLIAKLDRWLRDEGIDVDSSRIRVPGTRVVTGDPAPTVLPARGVQS